MMMTFLTIVAVLWLVVSFAFKALILFAIWANASSYRPRKMSVKIGGWPIIADIVAIAFLLARWLS